MIRLDWNVRNENVDVFEMADDGNSRTKARLNTHSIHLNTASFPCYPKNNPSEQPKKLEMTINYQVATVFQSDIN